MKRSIVIAAVLACAPAAFAAPLQDSGMHIRQLFSPSPERVQVLVAVDPPHDGAIGAAPNPAHFTVWLDQGAAKDLKVSRNGSRGPHTTIILLDESGSYKRGAGTSLADPAIRAYAAGSGADKLGLMVFGATAERATIRAKSADLIVDLNAAMSPNRKAQPRTNLIFGLREAIKWAIEAGTPGLRDVIIFSDAGDEVPINPSDWDAITKEARAGSLRVHAVVVPDQPKDIPAGQWLAAMNALQKLAQDTGGVFDKSGAAGAAGGAVIAARAAVKNAVMLEATLCGMRPGAPVDVRAEYVSAGARKAWTGAAKLDGSNWSPASQSACPSLCAGGCSAWEECIGGACAGLACSAPAPCPGGAACNKAGRCEKPCAKPCATWQECKGGGCVAKSCSANEQCGTGATCKAGTCTPKPKGFLAKYGIFALAGAGALLLIAAMLLLRKKKVPPPAVEALPPPPPEEPMAPAPGPSPFALDVLPETHLEAIGGWITPGEKWRLHKPKIYVGGSNDPADGNDIILPVNQISGKHAMFELYPSGDLWVRDLDSRNGTWVNGKKLAAKERAKLKPGDQIKMSQQLVLKVVRPEVAELRPDAAPAPAPAAAAASEAAPAADKPQKKSTRFDPGNR